MFKQVLHFFGASCDQESKILLPGKRTNLATIRSVGTAKVICMEDNLHIC